MAQTLRASVVVGVEAVQPRGFYSRFQLFNFFSRFGTSSPILAATTSEVEPERQPLLEQQRHIFHPQNESSSGRFVLSDGRKIGLAYYGAQTGPAVFYLHGYPGCRLSGVFFDEPGKRLGARIISVERPGIGISSPQPGRSMLDHAKDIDEVAEHLKLKSYGIIGVSGGGPYALACALSLPEDKLKSVSIVGGMGPIDVGTRGMNWGNWIVIKGLMHFPALIRWAQKKAVAILKALPNEKIVELVQSQYSKRSSKWLSPDVGMMKDPEFLTVVLDFYREHYKQGVEGYMEDGRVLTSDFGFRIEDIRSSLPIQLWYSKKDTHVPFAMGEAVATRLSSSPDFHVIEDETHMSLVLQYSYDALERLLEKM